MDVPRSPLAVAVCQYELRGADSIGALVDRAGAQFERAAPADLFVLPELLTADLVTDPGTTARGSALDAEEEAAYTGFVADAAAAYDAVVVGGSYNVVDDGQLYNRAPIGTPDGGLTRYDKRHLTPSERSDGKSPGAAPPPVVDLDGVGLGVAICYDVEFPETVRELADEGAEVLAVPSWTRTEAGHQRVRRCAAARAVEDQLYVIYVPLVGQHLTEEWAGTGRASVFAPCDDVLGPGGTRLSLPLDEHAVGTAMLDIDALRESRATAEVRPFSDYRERGR